MSVSCLLWMAIVGHPDSLSLVIHEIVYVILHIRMFPINGQHFSINKGRESLSSIIITLSSQLGPPYY